MNAIQSMGAQRMGQFIILPEGAYLSLNPTRSPAQKSVGLWKCDYCARINDKLSCDGCGAGFSRKRHTLAHACY